MARSIVKIYDVACPWDAFTPSMYTIAYEDTPHDFWWDEALVGVGLWPWASLREEALSMRGCPH